MIEIDNQGNIVHSMSFPSGRDTSKIPGIVVPFKASIDDHYWDMDEEKVKGKQRMSIEVSPLPFEADGVDVAEISGIPKFTEVYVGDRRFVVDDGVFEFTTEIPGTHRVILRHPKYFRKEVVLDAI
jgi:hypothetical protein